MIDAMVRKLDENDRLGLKFISRKELREILCAGNEEQPKDKYPVDWLEKIRALESRIEELEKRIRTLNGLNCELSSRVWELESLHIPLQHPHHIEKKSINDILHTPLNKSPVVGVSVKATSGEESGFEYRKPSPAVSMPMDGLATEVKPKCNCPTCGKFEPTPIDIRIDEICKLPLPKEVKPDTIQISRKVAKEWLCHEDAKYHGFKGIRPMADEVRKALEGK